MDKVITAMESAENEIVQFSKRIVPADAKGLVERWLLQVNRLVIGISKSRTSEQRPAKRKLENCPLSTSDLH